ncbi:hypothetical protein ACFV6U_30985 [Streptomyces sp. NPDC059810]|uniref:hypothetical protein n=1 Tax=Streptomyces sp. NPDC059810 TaxID=3346956 RepID=UPI0036505DB7
MSMGAPGLPPLMSFGEIEERFRAKAEIARAGGAHADKCWKYEPAGVDDQGQPRAETILQRCETGEWGPCELNPRSLLARDWFVGVAGRERPTAPLPSTPEHETEVRNKLYATWLAVSGNLPARLADAARRTMPIAITDGVLPSILPSHCSSSARSRPH